MGAAWIKCPVTGLPSFVGRNLSPAEQILNVHDKTKHTFKCGPCNGEHVYTLSDLNLGDLDGSKRS
jgi:hypothetical protein